MPNVRSAFWVHHPVIDQSAEAFAEATLAFHREVGGDFLKITPSGTWMTVGHGAEDEVWPNDVIGRRRVTGAGGVDWGGLKRWDWAALPAGVATQIEAVERIVAGAGDTPVVATLFNPMTQAHQLCGAERFAEEQLTEGFARGLETITANTQLVLEAMMDRGISGLYLATHLMQPSVCPPDEYVGASSDAQLLNAAVAAGLDLVVFHLHGPQIVPTLAPDLSRKVILHLEAGAVEGAIEGAVEGHAVWTGVPLAELRACREEADVSRLRAAHGLSPNAPLTAGCCVTLDVPRSEIARWNALA